MVGRSWIHSFLQKMIKTGLVFHTAGLNTGEGRIHILRWEITYMRCEVRETPKCQLTLESGWMFMLNWNESPQGHILEISCLRDVWSQWPLTSKIESVHLWVQVNVRVKVGGAGRGVLEISCSQAWDGYEVIWMDNLKTSHLLLWLLPVRRHKKKIRYV